MKRKVTCDRKANSCFLSPQITPNVQFGRGGIVPLGTTYLIPLNSLIKPQKGKGTVNKAKSKSKKPTSCKKSTAKLGPKKRKQTKNKNGVDK